MHGRRSPPSRAMALPYARSLYRRRSLPPLVRRFRTPDRVSPGLQAARACRPERLSPARSADCAAGESWPPVSPNRLEARAVCLQGDCSGCKPGKQHPAFGNAGRTKALLFPYLNSSRWRTENPSMVLPLPQSTDPVRYHFSPLAANGGQAIEDLLMLELVQSTLKDKCRIILSPQFLVRRRLQPVVGNALGELGRGGLVKPERVLVVSVFPRFVALERSGRAALSLASPMFTDFAFSGLARELSGVSYASATWELTMLGAHCRELLVECRVSRVARDSAEQTALGRSPS